MPEGILYGLIDNGVLAFATVLGIDIDKYFKGYSRINLLMQL